jgi:hypothetical protein
MNNKSTVDRARVINTEINLLVKDSVALEIQNAELKKVIRILASSMALNEEGEMEMRMSREQFEYIQRVTEENNVFLEGGK